MKYYIIYNGQQVGPLDPGQLPAYGLTPQSMVWHEGMAGWLPAAQIPELAPYLGNPYIQPGVTIINNSMLPRQLQSNPLTYAIISTVISFLGCCCLIGIIGVIAIIKANQANNLAAQGAYEAACQKAASSRTLSTIALICGIIGLIANIIFFSIDYSPLNGLL